MSIWHRVLAGLVALLVSAAPVLASNCSADRVQIRGDFGSASFSVDIADTNEERSQGLMHVPSMPRFHGMLFVFERPQRAVFWMENTLIPLDMLFLDETGTVRALHAEAVPMDRTPIDGGEGIRYVLEINGGMAERLGIAPGAELRHPAIDAATAAWPCETGGA